MFVWYFSLTIQPVLDVSWQKSIEVCKVVKGSVIATAEHPVSLTSSTANVMDVSQKLSNEAFSGAPVCLLNSLIQDVDGTKGKSIMWLLQ